MLRSVLFLTLASTALSVAVARDSTCTAGSITSSDGRQCTIECGKDHPGGDYSAMPAQDFQACISACSSDTKCATAQYSISNSYCYLKDALKGDSLDVNTNSVICQAAPVDCVSGPIVINGRQGNVQCAVDHPGGDYASQHADSLASCESLCAADPACVTAQYAIDNKYCYLKNSINPATTNSNVNGIIFSGLASSSTTKTTTTTSTTTTSTSATSSISTSTPTCLPVSDYGKISNGGFESGPPTGTSASGTFQSSIVQGTVFEGCNALLITPTSSGVCSYRIRFPYHIYDENVRHITVYATIGRPVGRSVGDTPNGTLPTWSIQAESNTLAADFVCGFEDTKPCPTSGGGGAIGYNYVFTFPIHSFWSTLELVLYWANPDNIHEPVLIDDIRLIAS